MTVSLIITTYNWPRALYLCLDSVMQQTVMPSEILVADDGSGISTRDVVRHFQNISPVPVHHIWHEDRGFRVAAIRNKAIAASSGDYIIHVDGDLILQRNFIQDHILFAREGCYVSGSRGIITEMLTEKVLSGEITSLTALTKGVRNSNNVMRVPIMAIVYRMIAPSQAPRSCNLGLWYEDTELGLRLNNSGVQQRRMKFQGVAFHLHHDKASRDNCAVNELRYLESIREHRMRCEKGLDRHLTPRISYAGKGAAVVVGG